MIYGFENLQDLRNKRVEEVGVQIVDDAVRKFYAQHNADMDALTNLFCKRTTEYKTKFKTATNNRLQPLDENGKAIVVKGQAQYEVALPLQMAGTAWGANWLTTKKMTVQDVSDKTDTMSIGDINWMRDHLLAALFANVNWNFDDDDHGTLVIKGLANNDSDTYQVLAGAGNQATANHYLAQAANISDAANPFPTIYKKLTSHPENSGEVIVFVASNLVTDIENLANFKEAPDPNIREGANASVLTGNLNATVPGKVVGYVDKCWIVEWAMLPDGYHISVTTGGERPLALREDVEADLRGFIMAAEKEDYPFYERQYVRRAGFGGWNRVGATVGLIGNASYSIPTGYTNPMR